MDSFSIAILEREKEKNDRIARDLAFLHLNNNSLINNFIYSETKQAEKTISEFKYGRIQYSDAIKNLKEQYNVLYKTYVDLQMENAKLYAIVERKKQKNSVLNIILKQVGFISGGLQVFGGGGICFKSLGLACGSLGAPLLLHGLENTWENGYYLVYREEPTSIPLKSAYRHAAKVLGGDEKDGDIAYSIGDLSLSVGSLFRSVLKEDSWKLFYYIKEDYILGWKEMGIAGLTSELAGDSAVGLSLYQLINNDSTNWNDLPENK